MDNEPTNADLVQQIQKLGESVDAKIDKLTQAVAAGFAATDKRFTATDKRLDGVEQKIGSVEQRLSGVDERLHGVDERIGSVEQKIVTVEQHIITIEQKIGNMEQKMDAGFSEVGDSIAGLMAMTNERIDRIENNHVRRIENLELGAIDMRHDITKLKTHAAIQ